MSKFRNGEDFGKYDPDLVDIYKKIGNAWFTESDFFGWFNLSTVSQQAEVRKNLKKLVVLGVLVTDMAVRVMKKTKDFEAHSIYSFREFNSDAEISANSIISELEKRIGKRLEDIELSLGLINEDKGVF